MGVTLVPKYKASKRSGRRISDYDREKASDNSRLLSMDPKAQKMLEKLLKEGRNISDSDREKAESVGKMLTRNDGGMAMKTRVF